MYYASHTKTMLPSRKPVPRSSRQSDHTKPEHCKETQTAVVWSCLPFIRSGQSHLARLSERGKKSLSYWYFKPTQPQRIISGLRKTFMKRYIVEMTIKAEKDPKKRVGRQRVLGRIYGMKYS